MSVVSVQAKSFILALFIRDDGERFLLGDNGYDFVSDQLHFAGNSIENDEVAKQGADGVMLAGQVRRSSVQSFKGYIGDGAQDKETIEQMRKDFIAFFAKGHHFRVVYVDCNRNAWQRKGGYLVDAPEVKELWQIHPEYSVGLNFEDVNYYSYNEDAQGDEILANVVNVPVSTASSGGLEWDSVGAISDSGSGGGGTTYTEVKGVELEVTPATNDPIRDFRIYGTATQLSGASASTPKSVNVTSGAQQVVLGPYGKNLANLNQTTPLILNNLSFTINGEAIELNGAISGQPNYYFEPFYLPEAGTYTFTVATTGRNSGTGTIYWQSLDATGKATTLSSTSLSSPGSKQVTFSEADVGTIMRIRYSARSDSFTNGKIQIQIEKGSSFTSFEAPSYTATTVNLGYNLFDKTTVKANTGLDTSGNEVSRSGYYTSDYIPVEACYYMFNTNQALSNSATYSVVVAYDGSKAYANNWSQSAGALVLSSLNMASVPTIRYARFSAPNNTLDTMEVCKLPTCWPYAAYGAPVYAAQVGAAQDYIYKSNGNWYKHKEVGRIDMYNGETIPGAYISSTGGLDNGAMIYYALDPANYTEEQITNTVVIDSLNAVESLALTAESPNKVISTGFIRPDIEFEYPSGSEPIVLEGAGFVWEGGTIGGPTTIINNSITNVEPVWTVYGPMTNPILENTTTGEQIEYVGTIGEGQTLTVDMGEQTALLNGVNVISDLVGSFMSLAPGANVLVFSCSNGNTVSKIGWSEIVG